MDVAECAKRLDGDQAYATVKTVMERLVKKRLLDRRKESRAYLYWPVQSRAEVSAKFAAQEARYLVEGFGDLAVANFVKTVQGNSEQVAQLRDLLNAIAADGSQ